MTPLDYSCRMGHNAIVQYLLDNHAFVHDINPSEKKISENTPSYNCLDIAIDNGHSAVVDILLNTSQFSTFITSRNDQCSKLAKLIKHMPLSMKILLDNCFDPKTNVCSFELIDHASYRPTKDHPLWLISQHQQKYLLGHRTIQKLLSLKMKVIIFGVFLILEQPKPRK